MKDNQEVRWIMLGEFLEAKDERNSSGEISLSQGISNLKFFQTPKQVAANSKSDKIVRRGQFAYNRATTRNGEKISIAYREGPDCTVSSAYQIFEIKAAAKLLPEYLMLWFRRPEFDRYARYKSKGSAHEFFEFDEMCRVEIPVPYKDGKPDLEKQQEVVDIWKGLKQLKEENEALAEPLLELCQSKVEELKESAPVVTLGEYIHRIDRRNKDNSIRIVKGISVTKEYRDPTSKVDMTGDLSSYKIVEYNQFGYIQTTNNEKRLVISLSKFPYPILISSVNEVFELNDDKDFIPEFLQIWFLRPEIDRYARYNSWGSARETFPWSEMCRVKVPKPSIEVQRAIVDIYLCAKRAKEIAEEADQQLKTICPALMQHIIHG